MFQSAGGTGVDSDRYGKHDCGAGLALYPARHRGSPLRRTQDASSHLI